MSRSDLSPIEQSVAHHLKAAYPGENNIKLVLGVSGGADSMALLHLLNTMGVELHVVHVNYQKRGKESDKDARLVETIGKKLAASCEILKVDPTDAGNENFQQWARDIRYEAFFLKAQHVGADGIVTAHHEDDQLETILQKILRGAGLASWGGMQVWDGQLFRPLLHITREEIEDYCRWHDIPYRTDETNLESTYARNFLRNEWLDSLGGHFPGWRKNVLRVSEQATIFKSALHYILKDITDSQNRIHRQKFLALDEALQKTVLLFYSHQVDETSQLSRNALQELSKLGSLQTGKSIQLSQRLELVRDREFLKLVVNTCDETLSLQIERERLETKGFSFNGLEFMVKPVEALDFNSNLYLDADSLHWPLRLRRWKDGDRFQPFGMDGHQTVAEHLTNRKISAVHKHSAVVLETFEEIICAVIFPPIENRVPPGTIAETAQCGPSTRECLIIKNIL